MKKIFLLIPALVLAVMVNAVTPGTQALRAAYNSAEAGSTLVLEAGTYEETERIEFTKSMTIMAAEGAEVIVKTYKDNPLTLGAEVKFIGIQFDGSEMGTREYFIRSYDATAGNELHFENCEVYNFPSKTYLINAASDERSLDSIIINNCYFHNNGNDAIYVNGASASKGIIITNSTFANSSAIHSIIEVRNAGTVAEDIELTVDHCTFYNNTFGDGDYSNIRAYKLAKSYISNCIFAHSEAYAKYAAYSYGGTISNCLTYNLTSGYRDWSPCAVFSNNITADPLFNDLANNKYKFDGNWTTMSISPARGAATDGSDLGDPRWYSAEVLPNVDFATPYVLDGLHAKLSGRIALDGDNFLKQNNNSDPTLHGKATWKIHATKSCYVSVTPDIKGGSGHHYQIAIYDANNTLICEPLEENDSWDGDITPNFGTILIPAAGDYKVVLSNLMNNSGATLRTITFAYVGGDVQAMPGTTDIDDAWFSSNGTRADGKISYTSIGSGCWAKWNINLAAAGTYNVTVNIQNIYGHNYSVEFLKEGSETPIIVSEGETTYGHDATLFPVELGAVALEAGNYEIKVSNAIGDAALLGVKLSYAGGAAIDLSKDAPANLLANADAILSDDWTIEGGKITHAESKALTGWAKWNVNSADYGNYNVTVNISSDNGHLVRVEIFEDEAAAPIYTLDETSATQYHTGDQAIDLGNIVLDAREYVVKVSNTGEYSHVQIASIVISYQNGARATLPASCTFADLMLSEKAHVTDGNLWFNTIGDSNPVGQWAKWNVKVADAGTFLFTMNVNSTNSQSFKISILDMNENELDAYPSKSFGSGDQTIKCYFNLAAGNYIVKLENTYPWSQGHIVSLAVTQPELIVLDETAATNALIVDNYRNGEHDIQIARSIVPGMYNTICLPFDVDNTQLLAIFGSDVELLQMSAATLSGNALTLEFEDASSINRGTPYLIQTSKAIVNPVFTNVEIKEKVGQATIGTDANFIGNFIAGEVPAGDQNLFLGPNDLLYFSQNATPIKGMRAYFHVNVPGAAQAIKHARIVKGTQVITEINLVDAENNTIKTIENGQLVITIDGVRYNVMGTKIQ